MKQGAATVFLLALGGAALAAPPTPAPGTASATASRGFRGALVDDAGQRSDFRLTLDPARLAQGSLEGSLRVEPPLGVKGPLLGSIQDDLCVFQGTMDRGVVLSFRGRCSADLLEGTYVLRGDDGAPRPGRFRAQAGEGKVEAPKAQETVAPPRAPNARPTDRPR
jgi:hypothetical protein